VVIRFNPRKSTHFALTHQHTMDIKLAVGTYERLVFGLELDSQDGLLRPFFTSEDNTAFAKCLKSNPSGKILAAGFGDDLIKLYSMDQLKEIGVLDKHRGAITAFQFLDGGNVMLAASEDGLVSVWRVADWNCLGELRTDNGKNKKGSKKKKPMQEQDSNAAEEDLMAESFGAVVDANGILGISVHPSEKLALSVTKKSELAVWDLVDFKCARKAKLNFPVNNGVLTFLSGEGSYYVIGSNLHLMVFSVDSKLISKLDNSSKVLAVCAVPGNSDLVLTAGEDGVLRLWNVKTGELECETEASSSRVRNIDVVQSNDGSLLLVSGDSNGLICIYRLSVSAKEDGHQCFESQMIATHTCKMRITSLAFVTRSRKGAASKKRPHEVEDSQENTKRQKLQE
jgi:protein MAK11